MAARYVYNQKVRNAPIRRRLDHRFLTRVMVAACLGSMLTFGYVYSARCHFSVIELGYQTQRRRAELEQHSEQRRVLELERARARAPEQIERRARRLGLRAPARVEGAAGDVRQPRSAVAR